MILGILIGIVIGALGVFMYGALVYAKNLKEDLDKTQ